MSQKFTFLPQWQQFVWGEDPLAHCSTLPLKLILAFLFLQWNQFIFPFSEASALGRTGGVLGCPGYCITSNTLTNCTSFWGWYEKVLWNWPLHVAWVQKGQKVYICKEKTPSNSNCQLFFGRVYKMAATYTHKISSLSQTFEVELPICTYEIYLLLSMKKYMWLAPAKYVRHCLHSALLLFATSCYCPPIRFMWSLYIWSSHFMWSFSTRKLLVRRF